MANFSPNFPSPPFSCPLNWMCFISIFVLLSLLSTVLSVPLYLKAQFGENEYNIVDWGKSNCSLNGIDLTALGLGRPCEQWPDLAPIYCDGKIIEAVNYWGERMLFMRDSKHFVDRPLLKDAKTVVNEFKTLFKVTEWKKFLVSEMSEEEVDKLAKFVNQNFGMADGALTEHVPEDWTNNPKKFEDIKDQMLKKWAMELNEMWKSLSKKMPKTMTSEENQRHSLINVPHPFFVPGGRFREFHYWDSYWIVRGLIASGMTKSVKNMCKNFAEMVNRFGFVPAGDRIYYNKRSQPPFLTLMVYDYFGATGDIEFLKKIMPTLEKELDFWRTHRTIEIDVKDKKKTYYQYKADTKLPRPEAFCQDVDLVKSIADPMEKAKIWHNIASASESGWEFSSRWIKKDEQDKKKPWKLTNLMTTQIVPMDLNALICGNFEMMAHLYLQIGDKVKSRQYHAKYQLFMADFNTLFYKKEHGLWYDFNLASGTLNEAYHGSAAMPLFTRCYNTMDMDTAERMLKGMEQFERDNNKLISQPHGVPASAVNSSQQWDFPNVWPPLQHMLIEGLRRSNNKAMADKARQLAREWVTANFNLYKNFGKKMWEKLTADAGTPGRGGQYNVQMDFGTTIGAVLDLLVIYGGELKLSKVLDQKYDNKIMQEEPTQFPDKVSEYRAKRLQKAQKEVDEINKSQKYWTASIYEPFALMTDEEFKGMLGTLLEDPEKGDNLQLKSIEDEVDSSEEIFDSSEEDAELPEEFDARQKWPECADIIGTTTYQANCGSCWAVAAAATLTDRICIARLKQGKLTDSKDPRAYVSAQYTMEYTPKTNGCKGSWPGHVWYFYQNGTVSGTDYEMYGGCRPYSAMGWSHPWGTEAESYKVKTPSCKLKCNEEWVKKQWPNAPSSDYLSIMDEIHAMPRVVNPIEWHGRKEEQMMREIMANGSIQGGFTAYNDLQKKIENDNIYVRSPDSTFSGGHSIKIIGWGQQKREDGEVIKYWQIVNSWGKHWGNNGLFKMRRGTDECGIDSTALFGTPINF